MKAIVWTRYGSPESLQLREVPTPLPKDNEVLIRVHAASVSTPDTEFRRLDLPILFVLPIRFYLGFFRPRRVTILGSEFAGEIASVGKDVTRYRPGDQVYGYTLLRMGTYAEYLCLPEKPMGMGGVMAAKPVNLTNEQAAAVPFGGLEALHTLGKANIKPGDKVLIVGAGGSIGSWAVQLARHYGAEVTGVDKPEKLEMLRSLGADVVIDYTREDFTRNGRKYDVILDTIAGSRFSRSLKSLNENGTYLNARPGLFGAFHMRWSKKNTNKRIIRWSAGYSEKNLQTLKGLIEAGHIKPVIDRSYPMDQVVEAHRYVDSGQKKGHVVMTMD